MKELRELLQHFLRRLWGTPLLLGWLLIGPLIALFLDGWIGFAFGLMNIVLIGMYAVFIRWMTPDAPLPASIKRPRLERALGLILFGLTFLIQLFDFGVWTAQPGYGWVQGFFGNVRTAVSGINGIPDWALRDVYGAMSTTIKQLIPTTFLFLVLGYRPANMGITHPHRKLTAMLVGITAAFGLMTGVLWRALFIQVLGLYLIGIFVNALPEELFFRGFLLPRLERFFANPLNALVISAILFNAIHIPVEIYHGASPLSALLNVFSIGYPSGLIWGYLYLRTRSILPGVFWHAANGNFGFMMMSL